MRFLADVRETALSRADDRAVAALAVAEARVLLTEDKDFGDRVVRRGGASSGVVPLRAGRAPPETTAARPLEMIDRYGANLASSYVVVGGKRTRVRPLT